MGATSATATQEVIASADCPRAVVGVAPCRLTSKSSRRAHRSCHDVAEARGSFGALDGRIPVRLRNVEEATKFRKTGRPEHRSQGTTRSNLGLGKEAPAPAALRTPVSGRRG